MAWNNTIRNLRISKQTEEEKNEFPYQFRACSFGKQRVQIPFRLFWIWIQNNLSLDSWNVLAHLFYIYFLCLSLSLSLLQRNIRINNYPPNAEIDRQVWAASDKILRQLPRWLLMPHGFFAATAETNKRRWRHKRLFRTGTALINVPEHIWERTVHSTAKWSTRAVAGKTTFAICWQDLAALARLHRCSFRELMVLA